MELHKSQWYVTWFFLSLAILDSFLGGWSSRESQYKSGTNLCHFIRVTMVWAPLVILANMLVYGAAFMVLTIVPIHYFGWSSYRAFLLALGILVVIACLVVAIIGFAAYVYDFFHEMRRKSWLKKIRALEASPEEDYAKVKPVEDTGPGFLDIVVTYVKSAKQQICPIISFKS